MPRLHHLNLSHNLLHEIRDETFEKNEELISLDISYNKFAVFSALSFKGLEVLEVCLFARPPASNCFIAHKQTSPSLSLQILNASHNAIESIDSAIFSELCNLKHLDLSNNQLTYIASDKPFGTAQLLESIKLNGNLLHSIGDAAFSELKLQQLDLSCNNLSSDNFLWPEAVFIVYLNLSFNAFTRLNSSVLDNVLVTDLYGEHDGGISFLSLPTHTFTHTQRTHSHASGLRRKFSPRKMCTTAGIMW
jgi:Leucine-rich repeat (LRR) protein